MPPRKKKTYPLSNPIYEGKEWEDFRQICLSMAGWRCERCGRDHKEPGVTLQVHHPHYGYKRKPWEYDPRFCEVLCRWCHGKHHGKIDPADKPPNPIPVSRWDWRGRPQDFLYSPWWYRTNQGWRYKDKERDIEVFVRDMPYGWTSCVRKVWGRAYRTLDEAKRAVFETLR